MGYQNRDIEIVDYQMYPLKDTDLFFRGPEPKSLEANQYFVCIGAAQTYGCFCEKPYPKLLEEKLNLPVLNLGVGGAGPLYFLKTKSLLPYINKAKFAVVQVMSGRSENNSLFESGGREYLTRLSDGIQIGSIDAYQELLRQNDERFVKKIVAETRQNWVNNYIKLLQAIKVPKILFWFSIRSPENYRENYQNVYKLFGSFPQLVNSMMIKQVKKYSDDYVECISTRGRSQLMISRFTGKPAPIDLIREDLRRLCGIQRHNKYYPSPEMHVDAARALEKMCKKYYFIASNNYKQQEKSQVSGLLNKADFSENTNNKKVIENLPGLLHPEMIFIDVGAKTGEYTFAVNKILKKGIIYAIEQDPMRFEKLKENCQQWKILHDNSIYVLHGAMSDQDSQNSSSDHPSLISGSFVDIDSYQLDTLFRTMKPDIIRIGAGESEFKVLKGSTGILKQGKAKFLIELNQEQSPETHQKNEDLYEFMNSFAYSSRDFYGQVLFIHPRNSIICTIKRIYRQILPEAFRRWIRVKGILR